MLQKYKFKKFGSNVLDQAKRSKTVTIKKASQIAVNKAVLLKINQKVPLIKQDTKIREKYE